MMVICRVAIEDVFELQKTVMCMFLCSPYISYVSKQLCKASAAVNIIPKRFVSHRDLRVLEFKSFLPCLCEKINCGQNGPQQDPAQQPISSLCIIRHSRGMRLCKE